MKTLLRAGLRTFAPPDATTPSFTPLGAFSSEQVPRQALPRQVQCPSLSFPHRWLLVLFWLSCCERGLAPGGAPFAYTPR